MRTYRILLFVAACLTLSWGNYSTDTVKQEVAETLRRSIMAEADAALILQPVTVTAESCPRSAGGKHDFYSEGDYWWPDERNPDGPYIQKDGLTNPQNFTAHRLAMIRFSRIIGALASAYELTHDKKYTRHALVHLKAWFIDTATFMNPSLLYAQAIKGVATGRGIGIIDTIQLMEVVRGATVVEDASVMSRKDVKAIRNWFSQYITWLNTHPYGIDEMNAKNNHGTCWVMQTACFAQYTGNKAMLDFCRKRYKEVLLPGQMALDGSFPLELKRTKPYGYSIFNLDAMTTICQLLSTSKDNLWTYETADGRSIKKGIAYLYPYLNNKEKWPFQKDVMFWDKWPAAQPALVFGAAAYNYKNWLDTWKNLEHTPTNDEVIRNLPVRHPLIWLK